KHEQSVALDGEFHVLGIAKMLFELRRGLEEFPVNAGKAFLERRVLLAPLGLADSRARGPLATRLQAYLLWGADAGDDVLALRVGQILAVDSFFTGAGIARECDPGGAIVAQVAEHHRLHRDRGAPIARDVVDSPVRDRAIVVPRVEYRADRHPQLFARILRDVAADPRTNQRPELADQLLQVIDVQLGVVLDPARRLLAID